jgi:hypothetical protein
MNRILAHCGTSSPASLVFHADTDTSGGPKRPALAIGAEDGLKGFGKVNIFEGNIFTTHTHKHTYIHT